MKLIIEARLEPADLYMQCEPKTIRSVLSPSNRITTTSLSSCAARLKTRGLGVAGNITGIALRCIRVDRGQQHAFDVARNRATRSGIVDNRDELVNRSLSDTGSPHMR
jgi:hypothetical protein